MSMVKKDSSIPWRLYTVAGICGLLFFTLLMGLGWLQFFKSQQYRDKEERQTKRRILQPAPRGEIFDREGRLLVGNQSRHSAVIYLDQIRKEFRTQYLQDVRDVRAQKERVRKGLGWD